MEQIFLCVDPCFICMCTQRCTRTSKEGGEKHSPVVSQYSSYLQVAGILQEMQQCANTDWEEEDCKLKQYRIFKNCFANVL